MIKRIFSIDTRSLALFRVLSAGTYLFVLYHYLGSLEAFFANSGVISHKTVHQLFPYHRFTLIPYIDSIYWIYFLYVVAIFAGIFYLIGYYSRFSAFVCFILYSSFIGRNPWIAQGGDVLLPLLIFWAIFLPTGSYFGVDGALENNLDNRQKNSIFSLATVGIMLQVIYVYIFGALEKKGVEWVGALPGQSGEENSFMAVHNALNLDTFVLPLGRVLREYNGITTLLTVFVFYLELTAIIWIFFPDRKQIARTICLAGLVFMHLGFAVTIDVGHFWLVSLSSLSIFVTPLIWKYFKPSKEKSNIILYYDMDCGFCLKSCLLLREFFLPDNVRILPAQMTPIVGEALEREKSWVVVKPDGHHLYHWNALEYVTRQFRPMFPIWIPIIFIQKIGLGNILYRFIDRKRLFLSKFTDYFLPFSKKTDNLSIWANIFLIFIIVVCFIWNIEGQIFDNNKKGGFLYRNFYKTMYLTGFAQSWDMFAPFPARIDGYLIVKPVFSDKNIKFLDRKKIIKGSWSHPQSLQNYFKNYRWRKLYHRVRKLNDADRKYFFANYAKYLCRQIKLNHNTDEKVKSIIFRDAYNDNKWNDEKKYKLRDFGEFSCQGEILKGFSDRKKIS